jgi:hypothetical protein
MRTRRRRKRAPLALDAASVLAGLEAGTELAVDDLPAGVAGSPAALPVAATAEDVGRRIRTGEPTVRRLIRTRVLRPAAADPNAPPLAPEHDPDKPGE